MAKNYRVGTPENPIRQSTIKSYFICEQQGDFAVEQTARPEIGTKAWVGSIIHRAIEHMHRDPSKWGCDSGQFPRLTHQLYEVARQEIIEGGDMPPLAPGQLEEINDTYYNKGDEWLVNYFTLGFFDRHHDGLVGVEIPWRARIGRWHCSGTIDLVHLIHDQQIHVTDFKTGQRQLDLGRSIDLQLRLYSLAIWKGELFLDGEWVRVGKVPTKASLFEVVGLERYQTNRRAPTKHGKTWQKGQLKGNPEAGVEVGRHILNQVERDIDEMGARLNGLYNRGGIRLAIQKNGYAYGACRNCSFARECAVDAGLVHLTDAELVETITRVFRTAPAVAVAVA